MHPCFAADRKSLAAPHFELLKMGEWFWPREDQPDAYAFALSKHTKPTPRPGEVPLVTITEQGAASIWHLVADTRRDGLTPFHPNALRAWQSAIAAIPRSVPLLWTQIKTQRELQAAYVGGITAPMLDGDSFGVAFALAAFSSAINKPVPAKFVPSATVDNRGNLGPVLGLEAKIKICLDHAPSVREFIVAKAQEHEAEDIAYGKDIKIVAFSTLGEVLEHVYPGLEDILIQAPGKTALTENIFRLAIGRRDKVTYWQPIAHAAKAALESWQDISDNEDMTQKLRLAEAISFRHDGNRGSLQMPPQTWIESLPQPIRLDVVAHIVQNAADCGAPSPADAQKLAESFLKDNREANAFPEHLRILGALGRLRYAMGEPREALNLQMEAIRGWLDRWEFDEISYPLSVAYVYAGALRDESAFAALDGFEVEWRMRAGARPMGDEFVQVNRARAEVQLHRFDEAAKQLSWFEDRNAHVTDHLRDSGLFWLSRALSNQPERAEALRNQISPKSMTAIIDRLHRKVNVEADIEELKSQQFIARALSERSGLTDANELAVHLVEFFPY